MGYVAPEGVMVSVVNGVERGVFERFSKHSLAQVVGVESIVQVPEADGGKCGLLLDYGAEWVWLW